jgi:hypothetical protein
MYRSIYDDQAPADLGEIAFLAAKGDALTLHDEARRVDAVPAHPPIPKASYRPQWIRVVAEMCLLVRAVPDRPRQI